MSLDAAALRLAWWLHLPGAAGGREAPPPRRAAATADAAEALRPAVELETRLSLRDMGWRG